MKKLSLGLALLFLSACISIFAEDIPSCRIVLGEGWNAYALDFTPDAGSMDVLRNTGEIIVWRNGAFQRLSPNETLGTGEGFFLNAGENSRNTLELTGTEGQPAEIQKGWNLCSATLLSDGTSFYGLDISSKAYIPEFVTETNRAVWIYAAALNVNDSVENIPAGNMVTKTAPEKTGHSFKDWTVSGIVLPNPETQTISFIMPFQDVFLTSNYAINNYTLTVDGIPEQHEYDTQVSVTAENKTGRTFTDWTAEGVMVDDATANPLSFNMPANDVTLTSNYSANNYALTIDGTPGTKPYDSQVTLIAETKDGKTFGGWWNISGISGIENTPTISFEMPANEVSLDSYYYDNGEYLVVNLETGESRTSTTAPDLSDDTCRTTELWLRKIPAGTFTMGSPSGEVGREPGSAKETQHQVTLTQDYYIGVFEVTQKQYELIAGKNPSKHPGDGRPVERVSIWDIRGKSADKGSGWPTYGHAVDEGSFLGKLRAKSSLTFDLPTEAQWEYACRAGTTTALNTGKNLTSYYEDAAMNEAGRNVYNLTDGKGGYEEHTTVGSYLPNAWGLYDMHGNVIEPCLDLFQKDLGSEAAVDPVGASTGTDRPVRGGAYSTYGAFDCRSAYRSYNGLSSYSSGAGFRVVMFP